MKIYRGEFFELGRKDKIDFFIVGILAFICEALLVFLAGFFFASISSSSIMAFKPQWLLFAFTLSYINYFYRKEKKGKYESISNFAYVSIQF